MYAFFILLILFNFVNSAKILIVCPLLGRSHSKFMISIADLLTDKGYNVTLVEIEVDPEVPPDFKTKAAEVIFFKVPNYSRDEFLEFDYKQDNIFENDQHLLLQNPLPKLIKLSIQQIQGQSFSWFSEYLRKQNFDLAIYEVADYSVGFALQYWNIKKGIAVCSFGSPQVLAEISNLYWSPETVPCKLYYLTVSYKDVFQFIFHFSQTR